LNQHPAAAGFFVAPPLCLRSKKPLPTVNFVTYRVKEQSMPNNNVNDLITEQEMAFAHLLFSGTMTDRQAAEAVGLKP
jgi:hypothetical protein